jgi:hypothetical protein
MLEDKPARGLCTFQECASERLSIKKETGSLLGGQMCVLTGKDGLFLQYDRKDLLEQFSKISNFLSTAVPPL